MILGLSIKYKIGDRVIIKSYKEILKLRNKYNLVTREEDFLYFKNLCHKIVTIKGISMFEFYAIKEEKRFNWSDDMFIGKVNDNKFKKLKEIL
jgi:hypothetical protein